MTDHPGPAVSPQPTFPQPGSPQAEAPTPPAGTGARRLPDDVVVGRVLRALTHVMWLLTAAAVVLGGAAAAVAATRPGDTLAAAIVTLLTSAGLALVGAVIALVGAIGARDAQSAVAWIARVHTALRVWGAVALAVILASAVVAALVWRPGTAGLVGAILAALVGAQVVPLVTIVRRRWPALLQVQASAGQASAGQGS